MKLSIEDKIIFFENRLQKVYKHLSKTAKRLSVSCYRIYNVDLPEFPFIIELYNDNVYVAEYKSKHTLSNEEYTEWLDMSLQVIKKVLNVADEKLFLKLRERQKGINQYEKLNQQKSEIIVDENKLRFIVNLSDYLDVGLFLDHRDTRALVKEMAADKRVLNLFAYTGSFTVYAAAGNAQRITTVDMSKTYITWAKRNLAYNKLYDDSKHDFVQEDVFSFLKQNKNTIYDIIILDPPTFSNSKRMHDTLDIQRDHVKLLNDCLSILSENGVIIFSTNYRNFKLSSEKLNTKNIKDITVATTPFDFVGKLKRKCYYINK